ncbi:hypothetical protein FRC03_005637 [Tulasnella sp. 419]|nr:hypothetical protein FRC03_005637 [Tulasnella sp. 419]
MASPTVYPTSPLPRLFTSPRTSTPRITGGFPIPSFHSRPSPRRPSPIPSFDLVIPEQGRQEPSPPFRTPSPVRTLEIPIAKRRSQIPEGSTTDRLRKKLLKDAIKEYRDGWIPPPMYPSLEDEMMFKGYEELYKIFKNVRVKTSYLAGIDNTYYIDYNLYGEFVERLERI